MTCRRNLALALARGRSAASPDNGFRSKFIGRTSDQIRCIQEFEYRPTLQVLSPHPPASGFPLPDTEQVFCMQNTPTLRGGLPTQLTS